MARHKEFAYTGKLQLWEHLPVDAPLETSFFTHTRFLKHPEIHFELLNCIGGTNVCDVADHDVLVFPHYPLHATCCGSDFVVAEATYHTRVDGQNSVCVNSNQWFVWYYLYHQNSKKYREKVKMELVGFLGSLPYTSMNRRTVHRGSLTSG